MTIYFDIDSTLLDTPRLFSEDVRSQWRSILRISPEQLQAAQDVFHKKLAGVTDSDPWLLAVHLSEFFRVSPVPLVAAFENADYLGAVYPNMIEQLEWLRDQHFSLGIISQAPKRFQMLKLNKSNILKYFEYNKINILRRKEKPENLNFMKPEDIIIDDKVSMCEVVATQIGASAFLANWRTRPYTLTAVSPLVKVLENVSEISAEVQQVNAAAQFRSK